MSSKRFFTYLLWLVLAIPAYGIIDAALTSDSSRIFHRLVHPTGEWSARFLLITLMATPLMLLFKGWRGPRWLVKNRRYFGVASFGYAALHTVFYILDKQSFDRIMNEIDRFYIWTGWLAFLVFLPLAATSMDFAVRKMGRYWKPLQRWTYAAAVLTLLHWASLHNWQRWEGPVIQFTPLILLTLYRLWWQYLRKRSSAAT